MKTDEHSRQAKVVQDGFAIIPNVLSEAECERLIDALKQDAAGTRRERKGSVYAVRNLLEIAAVRELAQSEMVRQWIVPILGTEAVAVRGLLFDKTPEANWNVIWHQDRTVAVKERKEVVGFGAWTEKAGVLHVQPSVVILEQMLSIRLHLDPCAMENGVLRVISGTHTRGILSAADIAAYRENEAAVLLPVECGDAILMRPLLLHASAPSQSPEHRRVIHLEYACAILPEGLEWHIKIGANEL